MAVIVEGLTTSPRSSITKQRSASPSKTSARSACVLDDRGLGVDQVLRLERVGRVVREAAVEIGEQLDQLQVLAAEHRRQGVPGHPVAGVHHHRQPADAGEIDQGMQVGGIVGEQILLGEWRRAARRACGGPASARRAISLSCSGSIGAASRRQNLTPL